MTLANVLDNLGFVQFNEDSDAFIKSETGKFTTVYMTRSKRKGTQWVVVVNDTEAFRGTATAVKTRLKMDLI